MICFYHPSIFSSNIRLVEQPTCCSRMDDPWAVMYLPKERCERSACLVHDHWSHTGRPLRTGHGKTGMQRDPSAHTFSLVHWTLTCPFTKLSLACWDVIEVCFIQTISLLEALFLLFFRCGKIPTEVGSLRLSSCVLFWATSSSCAFLVHTRQWASTLKRQLRFSYGVYHWPLTKPQNVTTDVQEHYFPTFPMKYINSEYINQGIAN